MSEEHLSPRKDLEATEPNDASTPTEDLGRQALNLRHLLYSASFSGPLPPPSTLAGYEAALPGSADRILKLTEEEAVHRREMERERVTHNHSEVSRGQLYAFILVLTAILGGTLIGSLNDSWAGSIGGAALGVGGMSAIAAIFITRRRRQRHEAAENDEDASRT